MTSRFKPRMVLAGLAMLTLLATVGGTVAGAATAAAPLPDPQTIQQASATANDQADTPTPPPAGAKLHVAVGVVLHVTDQRVGLMTKQGRQAVSVRPQTAVRINGKHARVGDLKAGDVAVVIGRMGPRGALFARGIRVMHRTAVPKAGG